MLNGSKATEGRYFIVLLLKLFVNVLLNVASFISVWSTTSKAKVCVKSFCNTSIYTRRFALSCGNIFFKLDLLIFNRSIHSFRHVSQRYHNVIWDYKLRLNYSSRSFDNASCSMSLGGDCIVVVWFPLFNRRYCGTILCYTCPISTTCEIWLLQSTLVHLCLEWLESLFTVHWRLISVFVHFLFFIQEKAVLVFLF